MLKKQWKRWSLVSLAVLALVGGTVGIVNAHGGGPGGSWGGSIDRHDELLAEELDITVEELTAAREAARARALEQALEEGTITEEQYEKMQTMAALRSYIDPRALMAEALGVSEEELADQSPPEWMEELDLDRETLMERMQEAFDAALEQAVADGVITEEEANELMDRGFRGGFGMKPGGGGRRRGRGGMRGFFGGERPEENAPLEDSGFPMRGDVFGFGF